MISSRILYLQRVGIQRRKKEIRFMKVMTGLAVLFLALTLLFQDNMNKYQQEMNFQNYGEWFFRLGEGAEELTHPYLKKAGMIRTGSEIYRMKDVKKGRDTIEINPADNEYSTGLLLGTMNQKTVEMGKICLYKGHMPEKDNEIALELNVLQALGYDYKLGQEISFYICEDDGDIIKKIINDEKLKLHRVTYRLSGTIKSYTSQWVGGDTLPGAILTEAAYENLAMAKKEYTFYQIKEQYQEVNVSSLEKWLWDSVNSGLKNGVSPEESGCCSNTFAYGNSFWSDKIMYRNMTLLLIAIGASALGYLMSSYFSRRRVHYYKLRGIGATAMQIRKMALFECVWGTLPVAFITLLLSYLISIVIVWNVAMATQIPFFYVFEWKTLWMIICCVFFVLILAVTAAIIMLGAKQIEEKRKEVSPVLLRWIGRRARRRRKRIGEREILKRNRMKHPVSVLFVRLIGIFVCAVAFGCLGQIYGAVKSYYFIREEYSDYSVNAKCSNYTVTDSEESRKSNTTELRDMGKIIPKGMLTVLEEMQGIKKVEYSTIDQTHVFDWEKKEKSELYRWKMEGIRNNLQDWSEEFRSKKDSEFEKIFCNELYRGEYYKDFLPVWEKMKGHLNQEIADYDKICQGKQVILLVAGYTDMGVEGERLPEETSIKAGDTLQIETAGNSITVEVAGVLIAEERTVKGVSYAAYDILGSDVLGRKIAKEDSQEYGYNALEIDLNALAAGEATGAIITRQCIFYNLEYDSGMEWIKNAFHNIVQRVLVYGTLGGIILLIYLFISFCIIQEERRKEVPERRKFHHMGMSLKRLRRIESLEGLQSGLCLWLSLPVIFAVRAGSIWKEVVLEGLSTVSKYCIFLEKSVPTPNNGAYIFYELLDYIPFSWGIGILVVLTGFMVILHRSRKGAAYE